MPTEISARVRADVAKRAAYCCECCLVREEDAGFTHQIDHIISRKHGGTPESANLAYACVLCNRAKGSDVAGIDPRTGEAVRLFNPRVDRWAEHFRIQEAQIVPLTAEGEATVRLLRLNAPERVAERALSSFRLPVPDWSTDSDTSAAQLRF